MTAILETSDPVDVLRYMREDGQDLLADLLVKKVQDWGDPIGYLRGVGEDFLAETVEQYAGNRRGRAAGTVNKGTNTSDWEWRGTKDAQGRFILYRMVGGKLLNKNVVALPAGVGGGGGGGGGQEGSSSSVGGKGEEEGEVVPGRGTEGESGPDEGKTFEAIPEKPTAAKVASSSSKPSAPREETGTASKSTVAEAPATSAKDKETEATEKPETGKTEYEKLSPEKQKKVDSWVKDLNSLREKTLSPDEIDLLHQGLRSIEHPEQIAIGERMAEAIGDGMTRGKMLKGMASVSNKHLAAGKLLKNMGYDSPVLVKEAKNGKTVSSFEIRGPAKDYEIKALAHEFAEIARTGKISRDLDVKIHTTNADDLKEAQRIYLESTKTGDPAASIAGAAIRLIRPEGGKNGLRKHFEAEHGRPPKTDKEFEDYADRFRGRSGVPTVQIEEATGKARHTTSPISVTKAGGKQRRTEETGRRGQAGVADWAFGLASKRTAELFPRGKGGAKERPPEKEKAAPAKGKPDEEEVTAPHWLPPGPWKPFDLPGKKPGEKPKITAKPVAGEQAGEAMLGAMRRKAEAEKPASPPGPPAGRTEATAPAPPAVKPIMGHTGRTASELAKMSADQLSHHEATGKRAKGAAMRAHAEKNRQEQEADKASPAKPATPAPQAPATPAKTPAKASKPQTSQNIDLRSAIEKHGGDSTKAFDEVRGQVAKHLASGGSVSAWMDGKEIPIAGINANGSMVDAKGQPWGMMPLAMGMPGTRSGIELKPTTKPATKGQPPAKTTAGERQETPAMPEKAGPTQPATATPTARPASQSGAAKLPPSTPPTPPKEPKPGKQATAPADAAHWEAEAGATKLPKGANDAATAAIKRAHAHDQSLHGTDVGEEESRKSQAEAQRRFDLLPSGTKVVFREGPLAGQIGYVEPKEGSPGKNQVVDRNGNEQRYAGIKEVETLDPLLSWRQISPTPTPRAPAAPPTQPAAQPAQPTPEPVKTPPQAGETPSTAKPISPSKPEPGALPAKESIKAQTKNAEMAAQNKELSGAGLSQPEIAKARGVLDKKKEQLAATPRQPDYSGLEEKALQGLKISGATKKSLKKIISSYTSRTDEELKTLLKENDAKADLDPTNPSFVAMRNAAKEILNRRMAAGIPETAAKMAGETATDPNEKDDQASWDELMAATASKLAKDLPENQPTEEERKTIPAPLSTTILGTHLSSNLESLKKGFQDRDNGLGISIARTPWEELSSPSSSEKAGAAGRVHVNVTGKGLDYQNNHEHRAFIDKMVEENPSNAAVRLRNLGIDWVNGWNGAGEDEELHVLNPGSISVDRTEEKPSMKDLLREVNKWKRDHPQREKPTSISSPSVGGVPAPQEPPAQAPSHAVAQKEKAKKALDALPDVGMGKEPPFPVHFGDHNAIIGSRPPRDKVKDLPLVDVNLNDLTSLQRNVNPQRVQAFIDNPDIAPEKEQERYPLVLKGKDGKLYIDDGNHRLSADKLMGKERARVRIYDASKLEGKAPTQAASQGPAEEPSLVQGVTAQTPAPTTPETAATTEPTPENTPQDRLAKLKEQFKDIQLQERESRKNKTGNMPEIMRRKNEISGAIYDLEQKMNPPKEPTPEEIERKRLSDWAGGDEREDLDVRVARKKRYEELKDKIGTSTNRSREEVDQERSKVEKQRQKAQYEGDSDKAKEATERLEELDYERELIPYTQEDIAAARKRLVGNLPASTAKPPPSPEEAKELERDFAQSAKDIFGEYWRPSDKGERTQSADTGNNHISAHIDPEKRELKIDFSWAPGTIEEGEGHLEKTRNPQAIRVARRISNLVDWAGDNGVGIFYDAASAVQDHWYSELLKKRGWREEDDHVWRKAPVEPATTTPTTEQPNGSQEGQRRVEGEEQVGQGDRGEQAQGREVTPEAKAAESAKTRKPAARNTGSVPEFLEKHAAPAARDTNLTGDEGWQGKAREVFGTDIGPEQASAIGVALDGSKVHVEDWGSGAVRVYSSKGEDEGAGPDGFRSERIFTRRGGQLKVGNANFHLPESMRGKGLGSKLFARQVAELRRLGARKIEAFAEGGEGYSQNGYYTWPLLGYDGNIDAPQFQRLPDDIRKAMGRSRKISKLYSIPGGKEAWKKHGGAIELEFDLRDGSESLQRLEKYLNERESRGVGTSEESGVQSSGGGPATVSRTAPANQPVEQTTGTVGGHEGGGPVTRPLETTPAPAAQEPERITAPPGETTAEAGGDEEEPPVPEKAEAIAQKAQEQAQEQEIPLTIDAQRKLAEQHFEDSEVPAQFSGSIESADFSGYPISADLLKRTARALTTMSTHQAKFLFPAQSKKATKDHATHATVANWFNKYAIKALKAADPDAWEGIDNAKDLEKAAKEASPATFLGSGVTGSGGAADETGKDPGEIAADQAVMKQYEELERESRNNVEEFVNSFAEMALGAHKSLGLNPEVLRDSFLSTAKNAIDVVYSGSEERQPELTGDVDDALRHILRAVEQAGISRSEAEALLGGITERLRREVGAPGSTEKRPQRKVGGTETGEEEGEIHGRELVGGKAAGSTEESRLRAAERAEKLRAKQKLRKIRLPGGSLTFSREGWLVDGLVPHQAIETASNTLLGYNWHGANSAERAFLLGRLASALRGEIAL